MNGVLAQPRQQYIKGDTKKLYYMLDYKDLNIAHDELNDDIIQIMKENITKPVKFRMAFVVDFVKYGVELNTRHDKFNLWGELSLVHVGDDFNKVLSDQWKKIREHEDRFTENGSGWTIDDVNELRLEFYGFNQLKGSGTYVDLPTKLANKKACINVKNGIDDKCFKWAILSCLHQVDKNADRIAHYKPYENELNDDGLSYPVDVKDIQKFADKNNLIINVFGWTASDELDIYHTDDKLYKDDLKIVNLLLIKSHFVWVKKMSALMYSQTDRCNKKYTCLKCLNHHNTQTSLDIHIQSCIQLHDGESKIEMPKPGSKIKFKNIKNMLKVPYTIYADFESVIMSCKESCGNNSERFGKHIPSSYYVFCVRSDGVCVYQNLYRSNNNNNGLVIENFMKDLDNIYQLIEKTPSAKMIISQEQEQEFKKAKNCYLCNKPFLAKNWSVRDHDHITGLYRGAAHNNCNLNLRPDKKIPVIIHNFRGYDSHLIVKELDENAKVIANNKEKFMTMTLSGRFRFIDSFQFLSSSLEKLVEGLGENDFKFSQYELLRRKGVFPYEYVDSFERYNETQLPGIEAFASSLDGYSGISQDSYDHAKNVWSAFNIQTLGQYNDLYLMSDVWLLADVFERFRTLSLDVYKLDPCNYISLPSLAWDALLLKTRVELDCISDINMYNFVELGIRGGISTTGSLRYHKANNKFMSDYDSNKQLDTFIMYEDMNNLYGWAMLQNLPTGGFRWINSIDELKKGEGYIIELDLKYPEELHDWHNDLPFAAEHRDDKLLATLNDKYNYVVHYKALEQMVDYGLKITKVHRILAFKESAWMAPYITMNTEFRKGAKTDFEKDFYKLMNNAVFGKSMENVRNRIDVRLIADDKKYDAIKKNPRFRCDKFINDDLCAVLLTKNKCVLDKPIYVGQAILDISKTLMYDYWYGTLKQKFGNNIRLMYTDTDSFIFVVACNDYYQTIDYNNYDISNFAKAVLDSRPGYEINNKRVGIPKCETGTKIIESVVALRSKMYSVKVHNDKEMNRAKGVKKYVVKKIGHEDYYKCLINNEVKTCEMNMLRQSNHIIYNLKQQKVSLSNSDDKRYYVDNVNSYAHGHYITRNML